MDAAVERFESALNAQERAIFRSLNSPAAIQEFLDSVPYRPEDDNLSPLMVFRDGRAHCFDGGLFAALALRRLGHPPVVVNMFPAPGTDDDHILALYRVDGYLGAVAKSNFPGLRSREPVYRSLRELVMSYFELFFNEHRQKTLRSYTVPLKLVAYDHLDWMTSNAHTEAIARKLFQIRRYPVISDRMAARLNPVDARTFEANMQGVSREGLYKGLH